MTTVEVALGRRAYSVHVGAGVLDRAGALLGDGLRRDLLVVTNETVGPLYLERARAALAGARSVRSLVLPDGEEHKTLATAARILDALVEGRFARDCAVVALGGGVVGDVAGFAAACYQRGVDLVQIPTSLLAQVDSAVGGKTAVNHPGGKNLIGAFHQPVAVLADVATLDTLPDRELRAGLAEVFKYGLVRDAAFLEWLEASLGALLARDRDALVRAVVRSCELKAELVGEDEREVGARALLNLGHTFGHAIETGLGYGRWLHGEAVAAGTVLAADLSARLGWLRESDVERIRRLFAAAGLPVVPPPALDPERMLDLMALDKKVRAGRLRLVLLRGIGTGTVTDDFDPRALRATLECRASAA